MEDILENFFEKFKRFQPQKPNLKNLMTNVTMPEGDSSEEGTVSFGKDVYSILKKVFRGHLATVQLKSINAILTLEIECYVAFMYQLADFDKIQIGFANCNLRYFF